MNQGSKMKLFSLLVLILSMCSIAHARRPIEVGGALKEELNSVLKKYYVVVKKTNGTLINYGME